MHWTRARPIAIACVVTAIVSVVFMLLPGIDIAVSRAFFLPGIGFPVGQLAAFKSLRSLGLFSMNLSIGLVACSTLFRCLAPARWQPPRMRALKPRIFLFLTATLAIGPGLIANVILKDHWGRARPINTIPFGGEHVFSLPWLIGNGCDHNCSFVSGEGSGSFWFLALAFVVGPNWRRPVAWAAFAWMAIVSLNRLAFGGHFLSDVLIGWGLMLIVMLTAREWLLIRWGDRIDVAIDRWVERSSAPSLPARSPDRD